LRVIEDTQLQLRKLRRRLHHHPFHPCAGRRAYGAYPTETVTFQRRRCKPGYDLREPSGE
jgi:hypothetical protein